MSHQDFLQTQRLAHPDSGVREILKQARIEAQWSAWAFLVLAEAGVTLPEGWGFWCWSPFSLLAMPLTVPCPSCFPGSWLSSTASLGLTTSPAVWEGWFCCFLVSPVPCPESPAAASSSSEAEWGWALLFPSDWFLLLSLFLRFLFFLRLLADAAPGPDGWAPFCCPSEDEQTLSKGF